MNNPLRPEQIDRLPYLGKWNPPATAEADLAGSASALFLIALNLSAESRMAHRWPIWALPFTGFVVGWPYLKFGQLVEAGTRLSFA